MRHFSPALLAHDEYLVKNKGKVFKSLKAQGQLKWGNFVKRFMKVHVSYLRMNANAGFFEKKRFSAMMIKDEPIVYFPTYKERKEARLAKKKAESEAAEAAAATVET